MKYIDLIISAVIVTALYVVSFIVLSGLPVFDFINSYMAAAAISAMSYVIGMSFFLACMAAKIINQHIERRGKDIQEAFKEFKK